MPIREALPAFGFRLDYRLVLETAPLPRHAGQVCSTVALHSESVQQMRAWSAFDKVSDFHEWSADGGGRPGPSPLPDGDPAHGKPPRRRPGAEGVE